MPEIGEPKTFERAVRPLPLDALDLAIPRRFTDRGEMDEKIGEERNHIDHLTGLAIENDMVRGMLIGAFTQSIRTGQNWLCFYSDLDHLKKVNDEFSRAAGDTYIKWGTAQITQSVDNLRFSPAAQTFVVRPSHAADETVVWMFGLSDEDLQNAVLGLDTVREQEVLIDSKPFVFGASSAVMTSKDEGIVRELESTRRFLAENTQARAVNLFQKVEEITEKTVKGDKLLKSLSQLPMEQLSSGESVKALIDIIVQNFGGRRVDETVLEVICKMVAIKASEIPQKIREDVLVELGVKKEEAIKGASDPKGYKLVLEDLLGRLD